MIVLQVSFRNHDSHKLYCDLYQGDGRVVDIEIIFYSTESNVYFLARHFSWYVCQEASFIGEW